MFLLNIHDIDDANEPLLKRCKQAIKNNERTNVSHAIMKRGDNALELNNIQYDIEEVDACLDGHIIGLYQDKKHRLYFDTDTDNVHVVLPIKHQKDTNISTFTFQPSENKMTGIGGEHMGKLTEKVVGTTFQQHKDFSEYFATNEDVENGVTAITSIALLIPEPDNPYDPYAVMVVGKLKNGQPHQIGYLKSASKGGQLQLKIKQPQQAILRILAYSDNGDFHDTYTVTVDVND